MHKEYYINQVEQVERYELRITMNPMVQVREKDLYFFEGYNKKIWTIQADSFFSKKKEIDFASSKFIEVPRNFKGRGLGTYIFNEFIKWAKQYHSDYTVKPLRLSKEQANLEEEKNRRNNFYRNFGFKLVFIDEEEKEGHAVIENVSLLNEHYNLEKVEAVSFEDFIKEMANKNREYHKNNEFIIKTYRNLIKVEHEKNNQLKKFFILAVIAIIIFFVVFWFSFK